MESWFQHQNLGPKIADNDQQHQFHTRKFK
jgi:hypothetical protein